jgi:CheY-like chemotaxis protein
MSSANPLQILIVDDYPELAETMAAILEAGCAFAVTTTIAHNGSEAVAAVRETQPNVVILDIDMPILNGFGAAAAIRALLQLPDPMLICATGNALHSEHADAHLFDHFLPKPVDIQKLIDIVSAHRDGLASSLS